MRRPLRWRAPSVALAVALAAACRGGPAAPPLPEVTLYATVGDAPVQVLAGAAAQRGLARVRRVTAPEEAQVLWLADPAAAVELAELLAEGAAPEAPEVAPRFADPARRFAPVCARARVLLVAPRAGLPFDPRNLRDLADPRLAGRVAVGPLGDDGDATALAALSLTYGGASVERFLSLLAGNAPRLAATDAEVRVLVARRDALVGLAGTEEGAAGALSAAGLDVVYPDQAGRGAVVLPTAAGLGRRARDAEPARRLFAFLAGPDLERLLAARVPGFMPLRPDVPVPEGVRPAGSVRALALDWDRLAARRRELLPALRRWPERRAR